MATKRGFSGWRSISKVEEASYDSAAAIATTFRHAADPIVEMVELEDGTTLIGTEAEEADEQDILARHAEGSENIPRVRPHEIALFSAYHFGNLNQSPANEPAAGYRTHTITPFPKSFTTSAQDGTSIPLTSLSVEDTSSFPSAGTLVNDATGNEAAYTGKTATSFTTLTGTATTDNWADDQSLHLKQPDYDYLVPSFTVLDHIGAALKKQWTGCMLTRLEISGDRKSFVKLGGRILASGSNTSPATARPAEIAETYLKFGDCTFSIDGTFDGRTFSAGTNINAKVRSFQYASEFDVPDELVYEPGGVDKMTRAERLRRSQSLQLGVEFSDTTERDYVLNQTNLDLQIQMVGATGSYDVKLLFPQFRMNSFPHSGDVGLLTLTQDAAVQQHTTYGSIMIQVANQQVDYLHA